MNIWDHCFMGYADFSMGQDFMSVFSFMNQQFIHHFQGIQKAPEKPCF